MTLPYISKPISLIEYYEQMRITDNCHQKTFNEVEKKTTKNKQGLKKSTDSLLFTKQNKPTTTRR